MARHPLFTLSLFSLFLLGGNFARAADSCSVDQLKKRCESILPDLEEDMRYSPSDSDKVDDQHVDRLHRIIDQVKKDIVAELRQGRSDSELNAAELGMIKKITSVKLIDPNDPLVRNELRCAGTANAFYDTDNHSVIVCPRTAKQAEASLYATLGHEVSHALSPCSLKLGVYRVRLETFARERDQSKKFWQKDEFADRFQRVKATGLTTLESAEGDGILSKAALKLEIPPTDMTKYPFRKAYDCLAKPPNSFVTGVDLSTKGPSDLATEAPSAGGSAVAANDKVDQCGPKNQMNEAMADWMGAKILGRYWERNAPKSDLERFAALGSLYRGVCPVKAPASDLFSQGINKMKAKLGMKDSSTHAEHADRVTKILLMEPSVRRMFACAPTARGCFDPVASPAGKSGKGSRATERKRIK